MRRGLVSGAVVLVCALAALELLDSACARVAQNVKIEPTGGHQPTPVPSGTAWPFSVVYGRKESCPDRIIWYWGMGEAPTVAKVRDRYVDDCEEYFARMDHVFEHDTPRRVVIRFLKASEETARLCVNWPSYTPC